MLPLTYYKIQFYPVFFYLNFSFIHSLEILIFHFLLAQKTKQNPPERTGRKGAACAGVFLATRPKNRKSAAKFSPRLRKLFTLLIYYTHIQSNTSQARIISFNLLYINFLSQTSGVIFYLFFKRHPGRDPGSHPDWLTQMGFHPELVLSCGRWGRKDKSRLKRLNIKAHSDETLNTSLGPFQGDAWLCLKKPSFRT